MDKYTPLIFGFLGAGAITAILFFFCWMLLLGPRRIRRAVEGRLGPAAIQRSIHTSLAYWVLVSFGALLLAAILGYLLWQNLGWWLYEDAFQGTWRGWLANKLNRTLWVLTTTVESLDYAITLPLGMLAAVFLGLVLGALLGTKLGRLAAAKGFLITKQMS